MVQPGPRNYEARHTAALTWYLAKECSGFRHYPLRMELNRAQTTGSYTRPGPAILAAADCRHRRALLAALGEVGEGGQVPPCVPSGWPSYPGEVYKIPDSEKGNRGPLAAEAWARREGPG